jgi:hypothetical protein
MLLKLTFLFLSIVLLLESTAQQRMIIGKGIFRDKPLTSDTLVVAGNRLGATTSASGTFRISPISCETFKLVDSYDIRKAKDDSWKIAAPQSETGQNSSTSQLRRWNLHLQNTFIVQGDPGFPAKYSGPNSLNSKGEVQETITADLVASAKLWRGAEAQMDFLMWQGFGLTQTFGIEAFPNGDAYKAGTRNPNFAFARLFIRQTIGLGGEQEDVSDELFTLAGKQDISRLTFTIGRLSPLDL